MISLEQITLAQRQREGLIHGGESDPGLWGLIRPLLSPVQRARLDQLADPAHVVRRAAEVYAQAAQIQPDLAPHAHVALHELEVIGRGGMGVVVRVEDRRLGRIAALKRLHEPEDPEALFRFQREVRITARLDHPAIPPVYEAGMDVHGRPYLLMRYIEGLPLAQRIKALHAGGPPDLRGESVRRLLEALHKVGEAIAYAHSVGLIHRDLKPENIMVGHFGQVFVMDWGIAREIDEDPEVDKQFRESAGSTVHDDETPSMTRVGAILGTPGYMAPEQIEGSPEPASDVYALGAILVAILTGSPPADGPNPIARLEAAANDRIERPWDRRPDTPRGLHHLASASLAFDPEDRIARADIWVEELRRYLAGEPMRCIPRTPVERARRLLRKHRWVTVSLVLLLVLNAVGIGAWWGARSATVAGLADEARESALALEDAVEGSTGRALRAVEASQRWLVLAPDDPDAHATFTRAASRLGRVALASQQWDLAAAAFRMAGVSDAEGQARVEEVQVALQRERLAQVEALLTDVSAGTIDPARALLELAQLDGPGTQRRLLDRLAAHVERLHALEADALRGVQGLDDDFRAQLDRALERRRRGEELSERDLAALVEAERRATRLSPEAPRMESRARFLRALRTKVRDALGASVELGPLLCEALAALRQGDASPEDLARALEAYLRVEPSEARLRAGVRALQQLEVEGRWQFLARLEWRLPQGSALRLELEAQRSASLGDAPDSLLTPLERARDLIELGRIADAQALVEGVLREDRENAEAWIQFGLVLFRGGDHERAWEALRRAIALDPDNAYAYAALGQLARVTGQVEVAMRSFQTARSLDPAQINASIQLGVMLHERGQDELAEEAVLDYVERSGDDPDAWTLLGQIRGRQGKFAASLRAYDRALELDPDRTALLVERAMLHQRRDDLDRATSDIQLAIAQAPEVGRYRVELARVLLRREAYQEARQTLDLALQLELDRPGVLDARWLRAQVCVRLQDFDTAIRDLEDLLRLAPPDHPHRESVLATLEELRRR